MPPGLLRGRQPLLVPRPLPVRQLVLEQLGQLLERAQLAQRVQVRLVVQGPEQEQVPGLVPEQALGQLAREVRVLQGLERRVRVLREPGQQVLVQVELELEVSAEQVEQAALELEALALLELAELVRQVRVRAS